MVDYFLGKSWVLYNNARAKSRATLKGARMHPKERIWSILRPAIPRIRNIDFGQVIFTGSYFPARCKREKIKGVKVPRTTAKVTRTTMTRFSE
jgi:hypothetical protein